MNKKLKDLKKIKIKSFIEESGLLNIVEEDTTIPFKIKRVFFVTGNKGKKRGNHAHKKCYQFFLCLNNSIEIKCNDGHNIKNIKLKSNNIGLLVPPKIWSTQIYNNSNSILAVFCNMKYNENEYIRNYSQFLEYIKK